MVTVLLDSGIKAKRRTVFDIERAIVNGKAHDQHNNCHRLIAHGTEFLITSFDGVEYCFNDRGKQFTAFPKLVLKGPTKTIDQPFPYVIYNTQTMDIVDTYQSSKGYQVADSCELWQCINITHPKNAALLKKLGITRASEVESDQMLEVAG